MELETELCKFKHTEFYVIELEIIEMCIPKKSLPRRINRPWMAKNLMRAIRKRNGFFRRARQNGSQSLFDHYKQQRNRVVKEISSRISILLAQNSSGRLLR